MGLGHWFKRRFGLAGATFMHKFDLGNHYRKRKVKELESFLRFKEKGTLFIILKSVAAKIDKHGNRHYWMYETDVHTYNPEDGSVLAPELEKEFKNRLKINELQRFKELLAEVEDDAIKERARDIYEAITLTDKKVIKGKKTIEGNEEPEMSVLDIEVPNIRLGKTAEMRIDALTPHDTIEEVMAQILEGKVLNILLKPKRWDFWTRFGHVIVGVSIGWILMVLFAAFSPDLWRQLWGFGSGYQEPPPGMIFKLLLNLIHW
jgi:hypothetical protein